MVHTGFSGCLLTFLVLNFMFQEPTKTPEQFTSGNEYADPQYESSEKFTNFVPEYGYGDPEYESPEKLTTFVPVYEYADPQYGSDNSFGRVPNPSLLEDYAQLPAQIEYIPSDDDKIYVPEEQIQLDSTGPAATKMAVRHHVSEHVIVITEQLELDATPTVHVDTNKTVSNETTVTPLSTDITILRFVSVMLTIISAVLFITTMLLRWNKNFFLFSIRHKLMYKFSSENTEVVKANYRDTLTI